MKTIKQFLLILTFCALGEITHSFVDLPVPASIYGMVYLLLALFSGVVKPEQILPIGDFLLEIMPLMFVPAGVGILGVWDEAADNIVALIVITVVSLIMVFAVSGKCAEWLLNLGGRKKRG